MCTLLYLFLFSVNHCQGWNSHSIMQVDRRLPHDQVIFCLSCSSAKVVVWKNVLALCEASDVFV